jgi:hypothetical protein
MPPTRKTDRVPNPGEAEPSRQRDRIVFGRPRPLGRFLLHPVARNRAAQSQPLPAGFAPGIELQTRVVGQNLYSGPNDEQHEQQVEEVQDAKPHRKSGRDRRLKASLPGIGFDEVLDSRVGAQMLCNRDGDDQQRDADRNDPQRADPASADAHLGDARHNRRNTARPFREDDSILCGGKLRLQRVGGGQRVRGRGRVSDSTLAGVSVFPGPIQWRYTS